MKLARFCAIAAAALLTACASVPAGQHGVVSVYNTVGAGDLHAVQVAMLDGVNQPAPRQSFTLAPGQHTFRVVGLMNRAHMRSPAMQIPLFLRDAGPRRYELVLDVEAGMHYTIAARFNGPEAGDWEPVVVRSVPINR